MAMAVQVRCKPHKVMTSQSTLQSVGPSGASAYLHAFAAWHRLDVVIGLLPMMNRNLTDPRDCCPGECHTGWKQVQDSLHSDQGRAHAFASMQDIAPTGSHPPGGGEGSTCREAKTESQFHT